MSKKMLSLLTALAVVLIVALFGVKIVKKIKAEVADHERRKIPA